MKVKFTTLEDTEKYYLADVLRFDLTCDAVPGMVVQTLHHSGIFVPFKNVIELDEAGQVYMANNDMKIEDHDYHPFLGGVGEEGKKFLAWVKKHKNVLGKRVLVIRG